MKGDFLTRVIYGNDFHHDFSKIFRKHVICIYCQKNYIV